MADDAPKYSWKGPATPGAWIGVPFNQTYGGEPSPYADSGAQLLDTMRQSGLLPGGQQNPMLNNSTARYAFKNTGIKAGIGQTPYQAPWDRNPVFSTGFAHPGPGGPPPGGPPPGGPGGPPPGGPPPGPGGPPTGLLPGVNDPNNPAGHTIANPGGLIPPGSGAGLGVYTGASRVTPGGGDLSQSAMEKANPAYFQWAKDTVAKLKTPEERYAFVKNVPGLNWTNSGLSSTDWNNLSYNNTAPDSTLLPLIASASAWWQ